MIDAVGVADQRVCETRKIDEPVPIGVIARQPRDLEAEHETDARERDLGGEAGKARSREAGTGQAKIFVDETPALNPT